ncbi:uncharacterized protein LOC132729952 [Ruditapes philippinarum]|uniref:uncharacterized protein LOC132729952 n=1 Tax=Ruditapes philippinarum TaxID=129788 RepID=UPI00295C04B0|nr:uncharacterized protein LOC132729952 [Ruditapes philippinarum]
MSKDLDSSHEKTRNDIKRIETIESTLARIVPQFESYIQNKTDDIKHRMHEQRIDKIESELALVSNKTDNLLDMNDDSENGMVQLQRTIKKAFHGEKIKRSNMELEMNEKIKNIEDYCVNFTKTSGQLINEFKKEVAIENKEFAAETDKKLINVNNTINDNKIDIETSVDDLENEFSKTKKTLSNLEDIILKDRTDGGWSCWGNFTSCSATCGRGIMMRSRTCTNPKPSLKGKYCEGSPIQIAVCNRNPCPVEKAVVTTKEPGCKLAEVDLVINIDSSLSMRKSNFQTMLDFCKELVDYTDVDSGSVRIGVLIYSTEVVIQFHLNEYNTSAAVKAAIDKIPYIYGNTNTADAILTMYSRMFTRSNGDRPGVPNVGILLTDGVSNINAGRTIPEANIARTKDILLCHWLEKLMNLSQ